MSTAPLILRKLNAAFRINGMYVPADSLGKALVSYVDPAVFHYESDQSDNFFLSGSCFRFRFANRYFAVATRHQLSNRMAEGEKFALINGGQKEIVTAERMIFSSQEDFDLLLFEFTAPVVSGQLSRGWYSATFDEINEPTPAAIRVLCIGYPDELNAIDYDTLTYAQKPLAVWGEAILPAMNNRLSFKPYPGRLASPSGLSGSPVFGICLKGEESHVFWAGILTNASTTVFNFIPADRVGKMLNWRFEQEDQQP